ncbi:MAG: SpoIIE family protein phosphatase [Crocinitomicaceae bacterium]|nr:SpoIIE family protein phosphatase [Crocinitomicaceae bacterium]
MKLGLVRTKLLLGINVLCFLLCVGYSSPSRASLDVDSLRIAYDYSEDPYERILIQIDIADYYYERRSIDTAIFEYRKAVGIIPNDSLALKASTLDKLAKAYRKIEDVDNMIATHKVSLNLYEQLGNNEKIGRALAIVGRDYYSQAKYDTAMTYYMDAKEVYERNNIKNEDYGFLLHFIGSVFKRQNDDEMACKYYREEIEFGRENNFPIIEAEGLYLSSICEEPRQALNNYLYCLKIYEESGHDRMIPLMYSLISSAYGNMDMVDSSLYYQEKGVELYRKNGEISHLAASLSHISDILIDLKRYTEAEKYLKEAEKIIQKTGIKKHIRYKDLYQSYFYLHYNQGHFEEAVEYQSLWYAYRDSSRAQEHQDAILEMEKVYNDEKQKIELALKDQEMEIQAIEAEKLRKEKESATLIKYLSLSGTVLVLILGVFVYLKYRESQKQKIMITAQKREMQFQKELVEEKNRDITDSIIYASSIQKAIITSEAYISNMFKEFFVFYKPRDIVSGDFYWAYETSSSKKLIAVGDCTGHGVPGAMMSMLGTAFLNEIVIEGKIEEPKAILNKLRDQIKKALKDEGRKDGMDISICAIDKNKLIFSGANLPLYILRNGELIEIKGNKQPVGYVPTAEVPFDQAEIDLLDNDQIYLFSDGYADQFGGDKGKKYKYKTFREKIQSLGSLSLKEQRQLIIDEFESWKGDLEQLDDVCVLSVRV